MKFKSKQTIIFSILTLLCIALCIFVLCLPMGLQSFSSPISMSQKIQVNNVNGVPILSGKIKNNTDDEIYLSGQCIILVLDNSVAGTTHLHITLEEEVTIEAGHEFDLASAKLYFDEYEYLSDYYAVGHTFTLVRASVELDYYGSYACLYDEAIKEEGEIYATLIAIFGLAFAIIALCPIVAYVRSKKRFALAQSALAKVENGVFLRGAFCQKKLGKVNATLFSKIKGNLKYLAMGVNIKTRYQSVQVMDFIITERGFYIVSSKSQSVDIANMEFFDKEDLDKTQIYFKGNYVVLNPLFNDNYFVFDLSFSKSSCGDVAKLLGKIFDEDNEVQNVYFDENSAQKNL